MIATIAVTLVLGLLFISIRSVLIHYRKVRLRNHLDQVEWRRYLEALRNRASELGEKEFGARSGR